MLQTRAHLLDRIDAYLRLTGMSPSDFGRAVNGCHKLIPRLRGGKGITLTVIEKAERLMGRIPPPPVPHNGNRPTLPRRRKK